VLWTSPAQPMPVPAVPAFYGIYRHLCQIMRSEPELVSIITATITANTLAPIPLNSGYSGYRRREGRCDGGTASEPPGGMRASRADGGLHRRPIGAALLPIGLLGAGLVMEATMWQWPWSKS